MCIEEGRAIKNEDISFSLQGIVTSNDALSGGEKEIIYQEVVNKDKEEKL